MQATHAATSGTNGTTWTRVSVSGTSAAYWALRVGAAMCLIGHGAFGFIGKASWVPYFAVAGIPERWAWAMMPLIGAVDVMMGMAVLFAPRALPLTYLAVWGLLTALLRPLSGESVFEAVERAGNYGVPLALLLLTGMPQSVRGFFALAGEAHAEDAQLARIKTVLKVTTAMLLAGHGALGAFVGKPMFAMHYAAIGLPASTTALVGWFEIALAVAVFVRPAVGLLLFVVAWKLATESLFVVSGAPIWEIVERGGSYAAPLALAFLSLRDEPSLSVGRGAHSSA